ncbi:hypothetical protein BSY16_2302 [Sinorhizobium sp. RAC02]|nr:hypothetical protein BSY16_2302 [Sinorhizobium sp. RAC02]
MDRLTAHDVSKPFHDDIGLGLASLIVRSPRNRNSQAKTAAYYQERMGFKEPRVDKNLISMNLAHKLDLITRNFQGGKYVVAYTDEQEFISGGVLYTNMAHEVSIGHRKTIVLIAPLVAVIYSCTNSYSTVPSFMTIKLNRLEVLQFNRLVKVYSRDQIFYRSQKSVLEDTFLQSEFLEYKYHNVPWLDTLLETVHRLRVSGFCSQISARYNITTARNYHCFSMFWSISNLTTLAFYLIPASRKIASYRSTTPCAHGGIRDAVTRHS